MFSLNAVGAGCYVLHGPPQITGLDHNPMYNTKMMNEKYSFSWKKQVWLRSGNNFGHFIWGAMCLFGCVLASI
jgi:hypothetical protein